MVSSMCGLFRCEHEEIMQSGVGLYKNDNEQGQIQDGAL